MAQRTTGLRRILSAPAAYNALQRLIGSTRARAALVEEYLRPTAGARILDIGCGPADILEELPAVTYVGFDISASYVAAARSRFGDRGTFFTSRIEDVDAAALGLFEIAHAGGVLHHVGDDEAAKVFELTAEVLEPGGRLVTVDPTFVPSQNPIARGVIRRDRGQNVRSPEAYAELAGVSFADVTIHVRQDLLRIPYTHAILVCTNPNR